MAAVPSHGRATEVEAPPLPRESVAAGDLYSRYHRKIYRYCYGRLRSREEAEDATQITFLNAFRGLTRGVTPELEQAWLYKIAENVCLTRVRSNVRRLRVESPTDLEPLQVAAPASEPVDLERMQDALSRLPEQQRRAILLREWQGLSYVEIATELGISHSAVETLIFRARRGLAKHLREAEGGGGRLRKLANVGSVAGWLKSLLLGGSTAAKVAAVVAAGAAVAVSSSAQLSRHHAPRAARPTHVAPAAAPVLHRPAVPVVSHGRVKPEPMRLAPVREHSAAHAVAATVAAPRRARRERAEATAAASTQRPHQPEARVPSVSGPSDEKSHATAREQKPASEPKPEHPAAQSEKPHAHTPGPNENAAPPATEHPQPPDDGSAKTKQKKSDEPAPKPDPQSGDD